MTFVLLSYVPTAMTTTLSFGVNYPFNVGFACRCCFHAGATRTAGVTFHTLKKSLCWRAKIGHRRTCGQREGEQVRQEVAGKVSFALVQRGGDLPADLLRHLGTHHGGDALGRLLAHLGERTPGQGVTGGRRWLCQPESPERRKGFKVIKTMTRFSKCKTQDMIQRQSIAKVKNM